MHVELLYHTPDPERAIATAARLCYAPVGAAELMETMPEERVQSVLSTIMGSGHFSTLEHASYTFAVDGVSRALTHQLVRHRIASFNQQSQRYVRFSDGVATVKPESVAASEEASAVFDRAIDAAVEAYGKLLEAGVPAEDARYLLSLIHISSRRSARSAPTPSRRVAPCSPRRTSGRCSTRGRARRISRRAPWRP